MSKHSIYPPDADPTLDPYAEQEEYMSEDELENSEDGSFDPSKEYSNKELEEWADQLLREDANRELCKQCKEENPTALPYGQETGEIEWQIQRGADGVPLVDDEGQTLYVGFPELCCEKGHRWYKGEGPRRDIRGPNPILFETHLYNRRRREIHVKDGIPDPAFTMDRWGKRPTQGIYNRAHPQGRKINTPEQRARNGASWYRHCSSELLGSVCIMGSNGLFTDQSRTNRGDQKTRSQAGTSDGAALGIGPTWW